MDLSHFDVIYEQRERVFHRDIQTRENKRNRMFSFADLNRIRVTKHNVIRNSIQVILHA